VRNYFYRSYQSVESVIDEWRPPEPGMKLPYDDVADVILDMLSRENRSPVKNLKYKWSRIHFAARP
jgi:hypothetical protein